MNLAELSKGGYSPLHIAFEEKSVEFLLDAGVPVDITTALGLQPIHYAAKKYLKELN